MLSSALWSANDFEIPSILASSSIDKEEIHKIVRGISRRANIVYDYLDGHIEYDDIEDPLPFDINAPIIVVEDKDYAFFYRDLTENMESLNAGVAASIILYQLQFR